jgi:transcriptional regulator with XRE-family HTH domain
MNPNAESYMPENRLLDHLRQMAGCKSDAQLGKLLGISNPTLSKIRHSKKTLSPTVILTIHEKMNVPVAQIRELYEEGKQ